MMVLTPFFLSLIIRMCTRKSNRSCVWFTIILRFTVFAASTLYDFCSLVTGRNCISLQTYPYTATIEQAFSFLKYDSNKGQNKYLLTLYIGYDEEENDKIFRAFPNFQFIETCPDNTILNFNIIQSALRQVTLMTITPN